MGGGDNNGGGGGGDCANMVTGIATDVPASSTMSPVVLSGTVQVMVRLPGVMLCSACNAKASALPTRAWFR